MPHHQRRRTIRCLSAIAALAVCANVSVAADRVSDCDVVWGELGRGSADSMPLGNGDIGLNVWTEPTGDICFYLSKTDAWAEENTGPWGLLKLGRVRLTLTPNPFVAGPVRQALRLRDGEVRISGGPAGHEATVRIWVDANHPVVRVDSQSTDPLTLRVGYETWRNRKEGAISADVTVPNLPDRVEWYHHNARPAVPQLADWTFGAAVRAPGLIKEGETAFRSATPARQQRVSVYALTAHPSTPEQWQSQMDATIIAADQDDPASEDAQHLRWWRDFWDRSWINVRGDEAADTVTRGYALQRFVTACAGRGYPIKFNGSIFNVDDPALDNGIDGKTKRRNIVNASADYRRWGGQYWFQNTRAMYWPRLTAGDFDLLRPLFRMYRDMLPHNAELVRKFYGHGGSYFAETAPFYGGIKHLTLNDNKYTDHYFTPILELSTMMLDYADYTGDEAFLRETALPIANAGLQFFSEHFGRDADGKLLLDPDNAIETYWMAHDPAPDIAGLHYLTDRLLALPESQTTPAERAAWAKVRGELPELPRGEKNGKAVLLPYTGPQTMKMSNGENPELYAIYPFRLFGLGHPELQLARDTFDARKIKTTGCWIQDPIQAAYLGNAALARRDVTVNFTRKDPRLKFPAFWAADHDYAPDEDNGGNGESGLQKMLMQCEGRQILLLPAWPKGWDADFKLSAPFRTTVEGTVRDGKLASLIVLPAERRGDVVIHDPQ